MKRRIFSLLLALAMLCSLLPQFTLPARAEDPYSGSCGETLSWRFDPDSGLLSIEGSGAMNNYNNFISFNAGSVPWYAYREAITAVSLPEGLIGIGLSAFSDCSSLTSVTIPNSVTIIGNDAFYNCNALKSVTIGNSVTRIGDRAFSGCRALTGVTIPNSVTYIGNSAFSHCTSLTSVTIPDSVTDIDIYAFRSCSALTAIHVAENNPNYSSQDGVLFDKAKTKLIQYPAGKADASYTIPNRVRYISHSAFYGCSALTSVTIPNSVTSIGNSAFFGCSALTSLTIPNKVTSIGDYAFYACSALTSLTIPNSVTNIGIYAFYGCSALTSLTIPESVTGIGDYAFRNCGALTAIHVAENNPSYSSQDGVLFDKAKTKLIQYPAGKADASYTIPNSVTSIGNYAFENCSALTSVTIPDSVTSIGNYAFSYCTSLTSVAIPDSVTDVGDWAFLCSESLTAIHVAENNPNYSSQEGVLFDKAKTKLIQYPAKKVDAFYRIPDSVSYIYFYAFYGCSALTSLTIPNSVTDIGSYAFYGCSTLTGVSIPDSVTYIGSSAFGYSDSGRVEGFTVYGSSGSAAQRYAEKYGFPFVVYGSPVITAQPQSLSLALGQSTTFKVSATGDDLRYQWQYMRAGDEDWTTWVGKSSASLKITASDTNNGCRYRCLVSNGKGSLYSEPATLTVTGISPQPVITGQPNSLSVTLGQSAVFQVTAGGEHLRYQWEYRRAGDEDWTTWVGRSSRSLKVVASDTNNGCRYRCLVSNDNGSLYSEPAILTVLEVPPVITGQPQSVSLSLGQTTVFKVSAIGGSLRYQWQYKRAGDEDWTSWAGKTFPSQKVTASETNKGCQYRCIVSNTLGSVCSEPASLTLVP